MLDRISEQFLYPNSSFDIRAFSQIWVVVPQPYEELYACGGMLALLANQGSGIHVTVIGDGSPENDDKNDHDDIAPRSVADSESYRSAANAIGYVPEFVDWQGRSIVFDDRLIDYLSQSLIKHKPDLIIVPSTTECGSNQRALALAMVEALRQSKHAEITLGFYELSAAIVPNTLLDISTVYARKADALRRLAPDVGLFSHERILSLNRFRAAALGDDAIAAEAYRFYSVVELRQSYLSLLEPVLSLRQTGHFTSDPKELPLVSVLIRSVNRPSLDEAIASVVAQTYPRIEIVVIDATAGHHRPLPDQIHNRKLRLVQADQSLARASAANLGLEVALGDELIFLDDDDFFYPEHIARLVKERVRSPYNLAAYADTEVIDSGGQVLLRYDQSWEFERLLLSNFLPIHAVLFSRQLLEQGCRFDESLPILEDWDFWLQVAQRTTLTHVPGVTAVYRYGSGLSEHNKQYREWRCVVVTKWLDKLGTAAFEQAYFWSANQLDQTAQLAAYRDKQLQEARAVLASCQADSQRMALEAQVQLDETKTKLDETKNKLDEICMQLEQAQIENHRLQTVINTLLNSNSWRVTKPLRRISQLFNHRDRCE